MAKGREESDGRTVPEGRRKPVVTAAEQRRGKATTASQQVGQLELFRETADSPQGADGGADVDLSAPAPLAVPKSRNTTRSALPAMTNSSEAPRHCHSTLAQKTSRRLETAETRKAFLVVPQQHVSRYTSPE
jgi:hypothetical protein